MSEGRKDLAPTQEDVTNMLMASTHVGTKNVNFQMKKYVYKRKADGIYVINIRKTWEKILLAARLIVSVENPKDICAISGRPYGQRAVFKFAAHCGVNPIAGRFTPGTFTNQIQRAFQEPRLLVVTDTRIDHQPIAEASYANIPVIAFADTDSPLRYVDVVVPGNNTGVHSVGLLWWMLAREVLRMRGTISRAQPWDIMPDLYFYRDPEEVEKEEQAAQQAQAIEAPQATQQTWESTQQETTEDWPATTTTEEWGATATTQEWGATTAGWEQ